jgi:hypothetical protein
MKRIYGIITADGLWKETWVGAIKRAFKLYPVVNGKISIKGNDYVVDPKCFVPTPKGNLKMVWYEGSPTPINFYGKQTETDAFTSNALSAIGRSKKIEKVLAPEKDMTQMLLMLSIIGNFILGGIIYIAMRGTP